MYSYLEEETGYECLQTLKMKTTVLQFMGSFLVLWTGAI